MSEHQPPTLPNDATRLLARQIDFTAADLQANHNGRLTPRQWERLKARDRNDFVGKAIASLGTGVVCGVIGLLLLASQGSNVIWGGFFLLLGGLALSGFVIQLRDGWQPRPRPPLHAAGSAHRHIAQHRTQRGRTVIQYYVTIGTIPFEVDEDLYGAFREGAEYIVYYDPKTLVFMSAEAVDERFTMKS